MVKIWLSFLYLHFLKKNCFDLHYCELEWRSHKVRRWIWEKDNYLRHHRIQNAWLVG